MHMQCYDHSFDMITVLFSAEFNPSGATVDFIFKKENGLKIVKDVYYPVVLNGRHRHVAINIFRKTV